jgi:hypothetical protein
MNRPTRMALQMKSRQNGFLRKITDLTEANEAMSLVRHFSSYMGLVLQRHQ